MNAKLTLTIEAPVIEKAKLYAKSKGRSLSDLIENYLKVVIETPDKSEFELTPIVKSLKGAFTATNDFDYNKDLIKVLANKYL